MIVAHQSIALILISLCGPNESRSIRVASSRGYSNPMVRSTTQTSVAKKIPAMDKIVNTNAKVRESLRGSSTVTVDRSASPSEGHFMALLAYGIDGGIVRKGCPAKLISPNIVQAAANCYVPDNNLTEMMKVVMPQEGRTDGKEDVYSVVAVRRHENDILLIRLNRDVDISSAATFNSDARNSRNTELAWDDSVVATPSPSVAGSSMASVMESVGASASGSSLGSVYASASSSSSGSESGSAAASSSGSASGSASSSVSASSSGSASSSASSSSSGSVGGSSSGSASSSSSGSASTSSSENAAGSTSSLSIGSSFWPSSASPSSGVSDSDSAPASSPSSGSASSPSSESMIGSANSSPQDH